MYKRKVRALFLCAGNACGSKMAAAYVGTLGNDWLEALSAGIEAHPPNPHTLAVMAEDNIDITSQQSMVVTPEMLHWADVVVTVCQHAKEHSPALPAGTQAVHWLLDDPAKILATEGDIMQAYRDVRIEIKRRIIGMIGGLKMMARDSGAEKQSPKPPP